MITIHEAIYKLNPTVVQIEGDIAYDKDRNVVEYDKLAAQAEFEKTTNEIATTKTAALAKLTAIGLTTDEIKALIG
jgi:hypothetical protein